MIEYSSKYRSTQEEIMDEFTLQGAEMQALLTDLKNVNKWLGGNNITLNGISKLRKDHSEKKTITILDVGCGDGEILRTVTRYAHANGFQVKCIGLDANAFILEEARQRSKDYKNITFQVKDVFSDDINEFTYDIALCTLFLHHFPEEKIVNLLSKLMSSAKVGVVVNDLQRNRIALWLFKLVSIVLLKTKIAKHDGQVSIARSFKKEELLEMSEKIKNCDSKITWKWAFRYQWILRKRID